MICVTGGEEWTKEKGDKNMTQIIQDLEQLADSLNTSVEICTAILTIAKDDADFDRIWNGDGTEEEERHVRETALNLSKEDVLFWGDFETVERVK